MPKDPAPDEMARADERLRSEVIVWLTTVRRDGQPQSSPVWFWWNGKSLLIFSTPSSQKVDNIARNPKVAVHLNDDGTGGDVVTIAATAEILDGPRADEVPEYMEKYASLIEDLGETDEGLSEAYAV